MATAISLHEALALDGSRGRYSRLIGSGWTFADRVFGGYTAALAASAARTESPHASLLAAHVVFLEPARPGLVELMVTELRSGRATWAGHTTACQTGRTILTCDTWFGSRVADGARSKTRAATTPPQDPETLASMEWLRDLYPFLTAIEERAVDYPLSARESGGPSRIEVWARPSVPTGADQFLAQMFELMLADAHLLDAALRPGGLSADLAVSLDLTLSWEPPDPDPGWLNFVADAGATDGAFVACSGAIRAQNGALRATASQQGRIFPGRWAE
jgi:acyl-CoA thioesterase